MEKVIEPSAERMAEAMQILVDATMKMDPQKVRAVLEEIRREKKKGA